MLCRSVLAGRVLCPDTASTLGGSTLIRDVEHIRQCLLVDRSREARNDSHTNDSYNMPALRPSLGCLASLSTGPAAVVGVSPYEGAHCTPHSSVAPQSHPQSWLSNSCVQKDVSKRAPEVRSCSLQHARCGYQALRGPDSAGGAAATSESKPADVPSPGRRRLVPHCRARSGCLLA